MSLNVYLNSEGGEELFSANITHNLGKMAKAAGIYECLWRPEEHGIVTAAQIVEPLTLGLAQLVDQPDIFRAFDAKDGWGRWDQFVPWCQSYLEACIKHPAATVHASL